MLAQLVRAAGCLPAGLGFEFPAFRQSARASDMYGPHNMPNNLKYRTRSLGGTLLVIKGQNDCVTIERNGMSKPTVTSVEGTWTAEEIKEARKYWAGSDAQQR